MPKTNSTVARARSYPEMIADAITGTPWAAADPRIVECWMRLEHGTLDHLDARCFDAYARAGAQMTVRYPEESRGLAESYGVKLDAKAGGA